MRYIWSFQTLAGSTGAFPQAVGVHEWQKTTTGCYSALTKKLGDPSRGSLDSYLTPFIPEAIGKDRLAAQIALAPGLDGNDEQNEVLGKTTEPRSQSALRAAEAQARPE